MARDRIYAGRQAQAGSFEFNDEVAEVFADMLQRSVPGYAETIEAIGLLASRFVQPYSKCYDLGCSLGAATLAMRRNIDKPGCTIVAVDKSPAMISRCRALVAADDARVEVSILEDDIGNISIENASMVVMNYTLQFLSLDERDALIGNIFNGLLDGGIFMLSEKVVHEDAAIEALLKDMHHQFKRRNAYSELEISRKRTALENVLIPETVSAHEKRLRQCGFGSVGVWLRHFNFVSIVARK
ncbi:MAG: carboxy-S-adenosyl-L-methionine synthase CmoA [Woeseiaceae bacterium]|nr:carboxy-S-adenosyl-L-methionine synthase CmoA [Woeseiaceae bacterium]